MKSSFTPRDISPFFRLSVIGLSWSLPILGLFSTRVVIVPVRIFGLLVVATNLHIFAYLTNDIIDVEIDRHVPRRKFKTLVRGAISKTTATIIAFSQVPLMIVFTFLFDGDWRSVLLILVSAGLLGIYNLYGKKMAVPILTDFVQGIACAVFVLFGAHFGGGDPTQVTYAAMGFIVVYFMLINGIHGGLLDLPTDSQSGVRTTALWLGASFSPPDTVRAPARLIGYASFLQLSLIPLSLLTLTASPENGSNPLAWGFVLGLNFAALLLFIIPVVMRSSIKTLAKYGILHIVALYLCIQAAVTINQGFLWFIVPMLLYLAPTLLVSWLPRYLLGKVDLTSATSEQANIKQSAKEVSPE